MADIDKMKDDIEELRAKMTHLIQTKGDLLDPEVLKASMQLDDALNDYYKQRFNMPVCCGRF